MVSFTKVNALLGCIAGGLLLAYLLLFKGSCSIDLLVGLGAMLATLTIGNFLLITKEQKDKLQLELSVQQLDTKIGNSTYSLADKVKGIEKSFDFLYNKLRADHKENLEEIEEEEVFFLRTAESKQLSYISKEIQGINQEVGRVTKYRNQTKLYGELICNKRETKRQITSVNELVGQVVERFRLEKLEKSDYQIKLEEVYDPNLRRSKVERESLDIILDNLLDNAFEAVKPQPDRKPSHRPTIKIETKKRNNSIEIIVQDNGVGMLKQTQSEIFDPFFSTRSETAQGLGLTLAKELLDLEHGTIQVESGPERGTKFVVSLPDN